MKKKIFWGTAIILVIAILFTVQVSSLNSSLEVSLIDLKEGVISEKIFANGKIEAATIESHFLPNNGTIGKLNVKLGDRIEKDQVIAVLDVKDLEEQLKQENMNLQSTQAELSTAQKEYAELRKKHFEEVKKQVFETGTSNLTEPKQPDYTAYQLRIQKSQSMIQSINENMQNTQVKAKISGIITQLDIKEGQMASKGMLAAVISDMSTLQVRANLNMMDVNKVKLNMIAKITNEAFSKSYEGTLSSIASIATLAEPTAKDPSVESTIKINEISSELRPGDKVSLEFSFDGQRHILAPIMAVKRQGDKAHVFVVQNEQLVQKEVKTGKEDDENIEILEGLSLTDKIVSKISDQLKEGLKVKVITP